MANLTTTIKTTPAKGNIPAKAARELTKRINAELAELRKASPRAKARTLDDGEWAVGALVDAWASRNTDDVACIVRDYGGTVPNSYKYRADSDKIKIEARKGDADSLAVTVTVERTWAPKRPHGRPAGGARLLREGETQGRAV